MCLKSLSLSRCLLRSSGRAAPNCQTRMMLVRVEARRARADLRTFGCRQCKNVHKALAEDPLKSDKARWLNSALKPPE